MTSTICFFNEVHLNNLLFDEWVDNVFKEVNVKEALKLLIFRSASSSIYPVGKKKKRKKFPNSNNLLSRALMEVSSQNNPGIMRGNQGIILG